MTGDANEQRAPAVDSQHQIAAWADSGAMALTGPAGLTALGPPADLVPKLEAVGEAISARAAHLGAAVVVDALGLLGERAAISGLVRAGTTSCGGATRLLRAGSDWLAVTLARPDDVDLIAAWLELDGPPTDPWRAVAHRVVQGGADALVERAMLVGLPIGMLPERTEVLRSDGPAHELGLQRREITGSTPSSSAPCLADLVVVDLSALWAGPLCGSLLAAGGATVIKVESTARPDGARLGPAAFFDLLNAHKRSVALDLRTREGVAALRHLLMRADVVIEASRPRALEHLGIEAADVLATGQARAWASITGHGRTAPGRDRVAFGDDAAVAGGLVVWSDDQPMFCADAIADPTTGLVATAAILDALVRGGRWLLDIPMCSVAAALAGPTLARSGPVEVAPPIARTPTARSPRLGDHTDAVLAGMPR